MRLSDEMGDVRFYRVAGFVFGVSSPYEGLLDSMTNLAPFREDGSAEENIFSLRITDSPLEDGRELIFRTDDGPLFPEISISTAKEGWHINVRPLPKLSEASQMWIKEDFTEAKLHFLRQEKRMFALNNALMLMFSFSTACRGALEMHSSVVMNGGKGYLFLGRSGTGKSTHSRLWIKNIPGTVLLNDDNPILRLMPDGTPRVFGSPWSGKTPCYRNVSYPVGAIVRLSQAPHNEIRRLKGVAAYAALVPSISGKRWDKHQAEGLHETENLLAQYARVFHLDCLPDEDAARVCFGAVVE